MIQDRHLLQLYNSVEFIPVYFDMDMSNGWGISKIWRVRSDAHSHSHKWRHAAAAMRANNVLRNSYNTRPLAMSAHNVLRNSYNTPTAMRAHNVLCNSYYVTVCVER
jgi:hypothetical protein